MLCPRCFMGEEIEDAVWHDSDGRPWHRICMQGVASTWRNAVELAALRPDPPLPSRLTVIRVLAEHGIGLAKEDGHARR
jgi:hypothetical protein